MWSRRRLFIVNLSRVPSTWHLTRNRSQSCGNYTVPCHAIVPYRGLLWAVVTLLLAATVPSCPRRDTRRGNVVTW